MAAVRAEALRSTIDDHAFLIGGEKCHATISAGVVAIASEMDGIAALLQAADEALYRAKSSGRNCVERAELPAMVCE